MECIKLEHVFKKFGNRVIIDDVSYVFNAGKIYGIVGHNGCGKSVLFKLISGLMVANSGNITINNKVIGKNGSMPQDVGILIEHPGFLPNLSGYENLKQLAIIKNKIGKNEILEALELVSLSKDKDVKVKNYSLGMLQRLGIAQALMEKPKILLLDEPFNSMDYDGVTELREVIKKYVKENNVTMLLTSHNKEDIISLADEILKFTNGKLTKIND